MLLRKSKAIHNRQLIFADILASNSLSVDDVSYICDVDHEIVNSWFYQNKEPSQFALMQLKSALYVAHMTIPKTLIKFVYSQESRTKYWGNKFKTTAEKPNIHRDNKQIETYKFYDQQLKLSEIVKHSKCVVSVNTLRCRIKVSGVKVGEDISKLASIYAQQGKKIETV